MTEKLYRTSNLYLSAVLIASGINLVDTEIEYDKKHSRDSLVFLFHSTEETRDIIDKHFNSDLMVCSYRLIEAYLDVKGRSKTAITELSKSNQ